MRQGLTNAMHVLPLLAVQFDLPWSGLVTCSDATLRGYAVQEADFPVTEVRQVGRWSERWRFKVEGAGRARDRALGGALLLGGLEAVAEKEELGLDFPLPSPESGSENTLVNKEDIPISINHEFPELPADFIQNGNWRAIQARRYHRREAIHMKELRAVLFG